MTNHYLEILDLGPGADEKEIKASFRKLAKAYHPDVNKSPGAKQKFIEIHEAYKFLTAVGPKPNNEPINYDFDPRQKAYDEWRERAKAYARKKAREAEQEQQEMLTKIYAYFDYLAVLTIIFNLLLVVDYYLPGNVQHQQVVTIYRVLETNANGQSTYRYDDIQFDQFRLRIKKEDGLQLQGMESGEIVTTPILQTLKYADFARNNQVIRIFPAYNVYGLVTYLAPLLILLQLGYFWVSKKNQNKLTFLIAIFFASLCEVYLFFRFDAINNLHL